MKAFISLLIAAAFCSCATNPGPVAPKPDIKRVIVANEKTKASIKKTKEQQQQLSESQGKVSGSLQGVMDDLDKLLKP
jgi:hypothetical protein